MSEIHRPHSPAAERVLIAAMVSGHAADIVALGVDMTWFYLTKNQCAFTGAKRLFDAGSEVTELAAATEFNVEQSSDMQPADQDDSDEFFARLPYGDVPNWMAAFNICQAKTQQRKLIRITRELLEEAERPQAFIEGLACAVEVPMAKLTAFQLNDEGVDSSDAFNDFIQEEMDEAEGKADRVPAEYRLHMGMPNLEDLIGYVDVRRRDCNIIIGAPSSVGKSAHMRQIMLKNLEKHEDWVMVGFLLESSMEDWWKAAARSHAEIDTLKPLASPTIDGTRLKKYFEYLKWLKAQTNVRLFLFDSPESVASITTKCREIKAKTGRLNLIVTDYIQILERERKGSTEAEVAENSRGLQQLQKRFRCPHITGSQLNEDGKVRESRAIYNDATIVWILDRPERDPQGNKQVDGQSSYYTTLRQAKRRGGPKTIVGLNFEVTTQTMKDL